MKYSLRLILIIGLVVVGAVGAQQEDENSTTATTTGTPAGRTFTLELKNLITDGGQEGTGEVVIQTVPEWAPLGAAHFHSLMDEGFYKDCEFFRVVPDFVVQFGIAAVPGQFPGSDVPIKDDPVVSTNSYGSLSFATAGPETRTTQLFINLKDNTRLDSQGFSPFAKVIRWGFIC